jgi:hypothetical protein
MRGHKLAVIAFLVVAVMALMGPALAQGSAEEPPPVTEPREERRSPEPAPEVAGEPTVLPVTGGDVMLFVLAGGATVAVGTALVRKARVGAQL